MSDTRSFLMLQGPMGSFFKKLAAALRQRGYRTLRVNFNGGDRLHFSSRFAVDFRGTLAEWPAAVTALAEAHGITDLILYGDCRPLHRAAIEALRPKGVRIHVFEEGYFRPHWVTLEEGGVNDFSPLPRDPEFYRALPEPPPEPQGEHAGFGSSFPVLARHTISYYVASALMAPYYRHYRTHRQRVYQIEGAAWLVRLIANDLRARVVMRRKHAFIAQGRPYFLVLLQLLGDSQITHHSRFHDMFDFLQEVVQDFARHAPPQTCLVIKNHPLDNGLARYASFLRQKARSLGLEGRLIFLDGGHLPTLLRPALGVVAVNSTAGLTAIHYGLPTCTMGKALYGMKGLVHTGSLASFWHAPQAPDQTLYRAFRRYVMAHAQLEGGFYTRSGIRAAVAGSVAKLLREKAS